MSIHPITPLSPGRSTQKQPTLPTHSKLRYKVFKIRKSVYYVVIAGLVAALLVNVIEWGTRLEDIELLRQNKAWLDALGAEIIPDPTTAGGFLRGRG